LFLGILRLRGKNELNLVRIFAKDTNSPICTHRQKQNLADTMNAYHPLA